MLRIRSAESTLVHRRLEAQSTLAQSAMEDIRSYQASIRRHGESADLLGRIASAEGRRDAYLAMIGDLLVGDGFEAGDTVRIGEHRYALEATAGEMRVLVAGEWETCRACVVRYVGADDEPEDGDDAPDEVAEWAHDYELATTPAA